MLLLVGGETGAVLHCSFASRDVVDNAGELPIHNPVVLALLPHDGCVTAVTACNSERLSVTLSTVLYKFRYRNLFATSSIDGRIHVYNILKVQPVAVLTTTGNAPLTDVHFLPARPIFLAVATVKGQLFVLDIAAVRTAHTVTSTVMNSDDSSSTCVHSLHVTAQNLESLAVACADGTIRLCQLGSALCSALATDATALRHIAQRTS